MARSTRALPSADSSFMSTHASLGITTLVNPSQFHNNQLTCVARKATLSMTYREDSARQTPRHRETAIKSTASANNNPNGELRSGQGLRTPYFLVSDPSGPFSFETIRILGADFFKLQFNTFERSVVGVGVDGERLPEITQVQGVPQTFLLHFA